MNKHATNYIPNKEITEIEFVIVYGVKYKFGTKEAKEAIKIAHEACLRIVKERMRLMRLGLITTLEQYKAFNKLHYGQ